MKKYHICKSIYRQKDLLKKCKQEIHKMIDSHFVFQTETKKEQKSSFIDFD